MDILKWIAKISTIFIFIIQTNANNLSIDSLLLDIEHKTDLSQKTKLENGGISIIYTRDDIERMQAHNLKDILKSVYPFFYNESRYGIPDPFYKSDFVPYASSPIKVYIDDQEILTGLYGSGLIIYGDMDIDFIDHIEIYSTNPTYEFSTEPAFMIVKLYSKIAQKDKGSRIAMGSGSYNSKGINFYNCDELNDDWSYFAYTSILKDGREKYNSNGTDLSRDKKQTHIFGSLYNENHKILIDIIDHQKDAFAGASLDATPLENSLDSKYLHLGYNAKFDNLSYILSFNHYINKFTYKDEPNPNPYITTSMDVKSTSDALTGGVTYKINRTKNKFMMGIKYRYKHFKYNTLKFNGVELPRSGNTHQTRLTPFIENQYSIKSNMILTLGVNYSRVRNNNSVQQDNLLGYRVGYTYTTEQLVSKITYVYTEFSLDPYMINSIYLADPTKKVDKTNQNKIALDIKYKNAQNTYELILSHIFTKNQLMPDIYQGGKLASYKETIGISSLDLKYTRTYNQYDKLLLEINTDYMTNIPVIDTINIYNATIRSINTYKQFDIFNELLYYRDSSSKRNFFDYSAGIIYHYNKDLSFALKGINLFHKARETYYPRVNPITFQPETSLVASPIDKKIVVTMEYLF